MSGGANLAKGQRARFGRAGCEWAASALKSTTDPHETRSGRQDSCLGQCMRVGGDSPTCGIRVDVLNVEAPVVLVCATRVRRKRCRASHACSEWRESRSEDRAMLETWSQVPPWHVAPGQEIHA